MPLLPLSVTPKPFLLLKMDILDISVQDEYLQMIHFLLREDASLINHVVYDGHTVRYHLHRIQGKDLQR